MYIDIHTHREYSTDVCIVDCQLLKESPCSGDSFFSDGIHPMYIEGDGETQLERIVNHVQKDRIIAIGECGFDKRANASPSLQRALFIKQVELGIEYNLPLIIHCVKQYDQLLQVHRLFKEHSPWIIHGFNGKLLLAQQLLQQGFYLSLGAALLHAESNASKLLETMPLNRLFLESDDQDIEVKQLYEIAAKQLSLPIKELEIQIEDNLINIIS